MSMNKTMSMFIAFIAIMIIAFFAIGFTSTVQAPTNATQLAQYNNLTNATEIASSGVTATMLLLILAMVMTAIVALITILKRR